MVSSQEWFDRELGGQVPSSEERAKSSTPSGLWNKCRGCGEVAHVPDFIANLYVCDACGFHAVMPVHDRIESLVDRGSFVEVDAHLAPQDPLEFVDSKPYPARLKGARDKTGRYDAFVAGHATLEGRRLWLGVFDFAFLGGSMGSVVGEKVTRLYEGALKDGVPSIIVSSTGGARMQEGVLSLMQMAKANAALARVKAAGLPFISVLAHPTTGGVAASFATLGDVNIAEPGALIGFAGPRVIEQTIRQKLPAGFQRAEFLLEHGMVDRIVHRRELRAEVARILALLVD
jgi:acetyl-CoA carboxylase carboxyl transferase subunit beta